MSEMLSQTKDQVQALIQKVQVLDFVLNGLNLNHKDYSGRIEEQFKRASNHKLKLTEELLRLSNAEVVSDVILTPTAEPVTVA